MSATKGKRVLVGITGSVAAYKAAELVRLLTTAGAHTEAAMTPAAARFVGRATMQALTGRPPITDMFAGDNSPDGMDHIAASRRADLMVVAPATASFIARLATGMADDAVSALACAAMCPVIVAPAMNREMWANPAVRRNVDLLRADGRIVVEPGSGALACGEHGEGRMAEPGQVAAAVENTLSGRDKALRGRRVVVSTGATAEAIDDMRVVTNKSSGRMGAALAQTASDAGASVTLVMATSQVGPPPGMDKVVRVSDAAAMRKAVLAQAKGADAFLSVAAVSDFRPKRRARGKIPRGDGPLALEMEPCPDIVAELAAQDWAPYIVAFAAEANTGEAAVRAGRAKMRKKGADALVVSPIGTSLGGDECELTWLAGRSRTDLGRMGKRAAAGRIIALLSAQLPKKN